MEWSGTAASLFSHFWIQFTDEAPTLIAQALHALPGPPLYPQTAEFPVNILPDISMLQYLHEFSQGKYKAFTLPHQALALQAIHKRAEHLCIVLPTGMGNHCYGCF